MLGTMITSVALPYQIYHLTQSTLMVGLLSFSQLIPLLFTALMGGVLADRYPRRPLLLISEILLSFGCLILVINTLLPQPHIWVLFVTATLMSAITGLHRPALESAVQQIVDKKDFSEMSALASFKYSVCMIGGSALAGLILAYCGLTFTFLMDFLTFFVSLICLLMIQVPVFILEAKKSSAWTSLKEGCHYALSRQELMGSYWVDFVAMIFGMPTALIPAMVANAHGSSSMLGLLYSAPAVGALILSCSCQWVKKIQRHGAAIAISAGLWGVAILCFGLCHNLWLSLFFFALAGAADESSAIFRSILWNETIPTHFRGRLAGIEMVSYLSGPRLGDAEAGVVAAFFGVGFSIVSGGVLCVAGVGLCCFLLPKFWYYRSTVNAKSEDEMIVAVD
jgi:MFS family permease